MVTETCTTDAEEKTFGVDTPKLMEALDKALIGYSKEQGGIDPVAVVAALSHLLCHAAYNVAGLPKDRLLYGVSQNYDFIEEAFGPEEGELLQ